MEDTTTLFTHTTTAHSSSNSSAHTEQWQQQNSAVHTTTNTTTIVSPYSRCWLSSPSAPSSSCSGNKTRHGSTFWPWGATTVTQQSISPTKDTWHLSRLPHNCTLNSWHVRWEHWPKSVPARTRKPCLRTITSASLNPAQVIPLVSMVESHVVTHPMWLVIIVNRGYVEISFCCWIDWSNRIFQCWSGAPGRVPCGCYLESIDSYRWRAMCSGPTVSWRRWNRWAWVTRFNFTLFHRRKIP